MRKVCPNCFSIVKKGDECPACHYDFKFKRPAADNAKKCIEKSETESKISPNLEKLYNEQQSKDGQINEPEKELVSAESKDIYHQKNGRIRWVSPRVRSGEKKAPKKVANPRVDGIHIDISKYTYFGKTYNKYSADSEKFVVKNNGEYEIQKLKWWEIYKWADRQLAKGKIKKQVNKEALKKPERVSIGVLLCLCLFSGFLGVHNFYAGNFKKGLVSGISFAVAMLFVIFLDKIPFFNAYFQGLLCAVPGLICILIWITDAIKIIFKRFRYSTSRMEYIKSLDLETRARLGKKYIYIA